MKDIVCILCGGLSRRPDDVPDDALCFQCEERSLNPPPGFGARLRAARRRYRQQARRDAHPVADVDDSAFVSISARVLGVQLPKGKSIPAARLL